MTQKLLAHFKRMQEMATMYLIPEAYTDRDGRVAEFEGEAAVLRNELFINDMIYMLDGPEQREAQALAELVVSQGYPTEDAYMGAMRALHWRTEQLRQAGIEPLDLISKLTFKDGQLALSQYPPNNFRFPITEAFPGDDHRQIYHAWRRFPRAMHLTAFLGLGAGVLIGVFVGMLA